MAGVLLAAVLVCTPDVIEAQATSFGQLEAFLSGGDEVSIRLATGEPIRGRIADVSETSLRVSISRPRSNCRTTALPCPDAVGELPREFLQTDILEISRPRGDSLLNGGLIGGLVGGLATLVLAKTCEGWCSATGRVAGIGTLLGGLAGIAIDSTHQSSETLFLAPGLAATDRSGFGLAIRF